ncbi:hypothetical protein P8452_65807 [Trifolium repens]|nr:hypothetical protein P8452_65807 [Trifolium repens]
MDTLPSCFPTSGFFSNHLLSKDHTICIPWIHHSSQFVSLCWCWNKKYYMKDIQKVQQSENQLKSIHPQFWRKNCSHEKKIYATSGRSCCVNA